MLEFDLHTASRTSRSLSAQAPNINDGWLRTSVQALQADGASMWVHIDGHWLTSAATDDTAARINAAQMVTGEGPGVEALITGRPIQAPDWAHEAHFWPAFSAALGTDTLGALYALPLPSAAHRDDHPGSAADGATTLGVLHIYRRTPGLLDVRVRNLVWMGAETVVATLACRARLDADQP